MHSLCSSFFSAAHHGYHCHIILTVVWLIIDLLDSKTLYFSIAHDTLFRLFFVTFTPVFSMVPTFSFLFFFISWRLITLQYYSGFCHTLTWISRGYTCIPHPDPVPIPPPTSLYTQSLWVFPVHHVQAIVSCIQPGLVICFTLDNIHVSMLFSWDIPSLPSPTESKKNMECFTNLRVILAQAPC